MLGRGEPDALRAQRSIPGLMGSGDPMTGARSPWTRPWLRHVVDALALLLVVVVRVLSWDRGEPDPPIPGFESAPGSWWILGGAADTVLFGDDAGDWASNSRALLEGEAPSPSRLPVFCLLTAGMTALFDDVVFAGHMVNKLVSLGTVAATYVLGRLIAGRAAALGAALLVAAVPALVMAQDLYGVDATFGLVVIGAVLAVRWGSTGPPWAVVPVGVVLGVCVATHYLGLFFVVTLAPLMLTWPGAWWKRLLALVVSLALATVTFELLLLPYPPIDLSFIAHAYLGAGVAPRMDQPVEDMGTVELALLVASRLPAAAIGIVDSLRVLFQVSGHLAMGLVVLALLGLTGIRFAAGDGGPGRCVDWRGSVVLAVPLALLGLLQVGNAPERYSVCCIPFVFLAITRGLACLGDAGEAIGRRFLPAAWPRGVVAAVLCGALAVALAGRFPGRWPPHLRNQDRLEREVGRIVEEAFPGRGPMVNGSQEVRFFARRAECWLPLCEETRHPCSGPLARCLEDGNVVYLVQAPPRESLAHPPVGAMDRWVEQHMERIGSAADEHREITVYRVPAGARNLPE